MNLNCIKFSFLAILQTVKIMHLFIWIHFGLGYFGSGRLYPYAVTPVIMLFSTGHTIEVFKFDINTFNQFQTRFKTRLYSNLSMICHLFSRRRHSHYPRVENTSFFEQECLIQKAEPSFWTMQYSFIPVVLVQSRTRAYRLSELR